jgi:hypothetical protein
VAVREPIFIDDDVLERTGTYSSVERWLESRHEPAPEGED